jgi:hypothetical protein
VIKDPGSGAQPAAPRPISYYYCYYNSARAGSISRIHLRLRAPVRHQREDIEQVLHIRAPMHLNFVEFTGAPAHKVEQIWELSQYSCSVPLLVGCYSYQQIDHCTVHTTHLWVLDVRF